MVFKKGSKINLGRKRPDVTQRNLINNPIKKIIHPMKDKKHTEETKQKMRKNHWSNKQGYVHPMLGKHLSESTKEKKRLRLIGRSYEDIYGITKATEIKNKQRKQMKDKTFEERYGIENAIKIKKILSDNRKNKTYEEIYGIDNSKKIKDDIGKKSIQRESWKTISKYQYPEKEKHPNWIDGRSFEPYNSDFNKKFKNKIRERDNQVCINCGIHREKLNEALHIHHINYDKELSIKENCCSLCRKCHLFTNSNREYWTKLFYDKLTKLYDYKYTEDRNIVLDLELSKGGVTEC